MLAALPLAAVGCAAPRSSESGVAGEDRDAAGPAHSGRGTDPDSPATTATRPRSDLPPAARSARYLLLGELHDNPHVHRLRLDWLHQLLARTRFVLAMEQFDTSMQPQLDEARKLHVHDGGTEQQRSHRLAQAAGFSFDGWDWPLYEPVVSFALRNGLTLVGANLSNADASAVARGAAGAIDASAPAGWSAADEASMQAAIRDGHCGLLPESAVDGMMRAQLARDRTMARVLYEAARRTRLPVVLLAGNGHVRADIGVPRHLAEFDREGPIVAIGMGEEQAPPDGRFDGFRSVEPVSRSDPCAALRERFGGVKR